MKNIQQDTSRDYTIQSVQSALQVLNLFIPQNEERSLMEISVQLDMHKSTVLRMVSTLMGEGYLKLNPDTRKYSLGTQSMRLGLSAYDNLSLRKVAEPVLKELANKTGFVIHLAINDRQNVVVVCKVFPDKRTFSIDRSQVGGIIPTYCTGIGLLFLSQESDDFVRQYLQGIERIPYTETTMTDVDSIVERVRKVREDDYCINNGEHEAGIVSLCYPIRDRKGQVAAGLSVSNVREVVLRTDLEALGRLVRDSAQNISRQLGYAD